MKKIGFIGVLLYLTGLKSKKIMIFNLRGGLGNQLFQIAGIARLNQCFQRDIVFCDFDVRLNPRDKNGAVVQKLDFSELFIPKISTYDVGRSARLLVKLLRTKRIPIDHIPRVNLDVTKVLPDESVILAYGYLQDAEYGEAIPKNSILKIFGKTQSDQLKLNSIAMHIRGTDALADTEMTLDAKYYTKALQKLGIQASDKVDVFTDDFDYALKICSEINLKRFEFPELEVRMSPLDLLLTLSSYERIISSKSTLCWWAALLAVKKNEKAQITSPWSTNLTLNRWITIK